MDNESSMYGIDLSKTDVDTIDLCRRGLQAGEILALSNILRNFTLLNVKFGYNNLRDEGAALVADYLKSNSTITCLDLGFNNIGDQGARALSGSLTLNNTLEILYLSGNLITKVGFKHLGYALKVNTALREFYLTGNAGGPDGATALADALAVNRTLQLLYLSTNKIGTPGAVAIAAALHNNNVLKTLYMGDNNIGDVGLVAVAEASRGLFLPEALHVPFNQISSVGIEALTSVATAQATLRVLKLDNNRLGDRGAEMLAKSMPSMVLEELLVGFNNMTTAGISFLLNALQRCPLLKVLMLSGNCVSADGAGMIAAVLATNSSLQKLYLDNMGIATAGERQIAASIALNRACGLRLLTGFELGQALTALGSPPQLSVLSNESVLVYLRECVAADNHQTAPSQASEQFVKRQIPLQPTGTVRVDSVIELAGDMTLSGGSVSSSNTHQQLSSATCPPQRLRTVQLPDFLRTLREFSNVPFSRSELWRLHQIFFSPPQSGDSAAPLGDNTCDSTATFLHASEDCRTRVVIDPTSQSSNKRPTNRSTVAPITEFPNLKARLKHLISTGSEIDQKSALTFLRQLHYLLFGCCSVTVEGIGSANAEEILLQML